MATVADVLNYIETLAPPYMKEDWDNVGLLCGRREQEVRKVLVALDPFRNVVEEAIAAGADLIVTHHPLIFGDSLSAVTGDDETGRCILALAAHRISAINAHTNLDLAPGGVNDVLAETLGLENIRVMTPEGTDAEGRPYGLLRAGTVKQQPLDAFLEHVKTSLGCPGLRYVDGGRPVHQVAVGGGACGGGIAEACEAGCDTFVTSDIKYNGFWDAKFLGMNLIDAGHFYTENPVITVLAEKISAQFPEIQVKISETHHDCMKFY